MSLRSQRNHLMCVCVCVCVCIAVQDVRVGAVFPDCVAECMGLGPIWPEPVSGGGETPPHLRGSP